MAKPKTEAQFRGELIPMMRRLWLWPKTTTNAWICRFCGKSNHPEGNIPDITCRNAPVAVEVKMFSPPEDGDYLRSGFAFSNITPGQREWLTFFCEDNEGHGGYLGIGMRHGITGGKNTPRRAWLPPWNIYLEMEEVVYRETGKKTVALFNRSHISRAAQDQDLNFKRWFAPWELNWFNGGWHVPFGHDLTQYLRNGLERDTKEETARWKT